VGFSDPFNGYIDEVAFFCQAPGADQIKRLVIEVPSSTPGVSDAPPAEREALGSPLKGGWIKRSSIKFGNRKHEMRNVIEKYGTQIFTDFHR